MNCMKYIIVKDTWERIPILFPSSIQHTTMLAAIRSQLTVEAVSAGFIVHEPDGVGCFGKSVSLGIGPNEQDSAIISRLLKMEN